MALSKSLCVVETGIADTTEMGYGTSYNGYKICTCHGLACRTRIYMLRDMTNDLRDCWNHSLTIDPDDDNFKNGQVDVICRMLYDCFPVTISYT